jgi:hypothetical protein
MNAIANKRAAGGAGSNDRTQKILLGVLGGVLVLLLVWQVPKILGGSSSETVTPVAAVTAPIAASTTTSAPVTGTAVTLTAKERRAARLIKRMPARDPFVPLASATVAATVAPPVTQAPAPTPAPTPKPATPAPTPKPATPKVPVVPTVVPTAAVIWTDGRRQIVHVKQTFKVGDSTFRLASVTRKTSTIVPVSGDLAGGKRQVVLARTEPVTLENTTTGVRYVLRFSDAMTSVPDTGGK